MWLNGEGYRSLERRDQGPKQGFTKLVTSWAEMIHLHESSTSQPAVCAEVSGCVIFRRQGGETPGTDLEQIKDGCVFDAHWQPCLRWALIHKCAMIKTTALSAQVRADWIMAHQTVHLQVDKDIMAVLFKGICSFTLEFLCLVSW